MANEELFDRMADCAQSESWELMSLEELLRLEAAGKLCGEDDLWIEVNGAPLPIRKEIDRRLELNRRARIVLKGDPTPLEL